MKQQINHIILLTLAALSLFTHTANAQNTSSGTSKSTLEFDDPVHDFGTIQELAGPVSHSFGFTNTGANAIVIEHVSVSCGCTTPEYSTQPVQPGKRGTIKVTFDPEYRPGHFSKEIHIISNGSKNRNVLVVKGDVTPRPRTVEDDYPYMMAGTMRFSNLSANYRYVPQGSPKSMTIGYVNVSDKTVSLDFEVSPSDRAFTVSAPKNIAPGSKGEITFTTSITKGDKYGRFSYRVYPVIDGKRQSLSFSVSGIATDDFSGVDEKTAPKAKLTSYFQHFGDLAKGKKESKEFTLVNEGYQPLIVRAIETRPGITTTLKTGTVLEPGKHVTFNCTLDTSGADKGVYTQTLTIITNDPLRPMRELRLAANVK